MMFSFKKFIYFFALAITLTCSLVSARGCLNAKLGFQASSPNEILNKQTLKSYIVFFKPETDLDIVREAEEDIECSGGVIKHRYRVGVIGFSAQVPSDVVNTFSTSPHIQIAEEDQEVYTFNDIEKVAL